MDPFASFLRPSDAKALCVWRNGSCLSTEVFRVVADEFGLQYREARSLKQVKTDLLKRKVAVLLVDVHHFHSRELIQFVRQQAPGIPVILLLPPNTSELPVWAEIAEGWDFIVLPCTMLELKLRVERALKHTSSSDEVKSRSLIRLPTLSSSVLSEQAELSPWDPVLLETVESLFAMLHLGDVIVATHSLRTAAYASVLAQAVGMLEDNVQAIRLASLLHDVGKLGVARHVLYKPGKLSREEFEHIKDHVEFGLFPLKRHRLLRPLTKILRHVHEHFDGSGYPDGLRGHEIPFESRIIALADAFDALTSDRPYRPALPLDEALRVLRLDAGRRWDPNLVKLINELWERKELNVVPSWAVPRTLEYGTALDQVAFLERLIKGKEGEGKSKEKPLKFKKHLMLA